MAQALGRAILCPIMRATTDVLPPLIEIPVAQDREQPSSYIGALCELMLFFEGFRDTVLYELAGVLRIMCQRVSVVSKMRQLSD